MSQLIPVDALPNQSFTITLDGLFYEIALKQTGGCLSATIVRENETIVSGMRCVAGSLIIPYAYLEKGNFAIYTLNDELPNYERLGIDQFLIYFPQDELDAERAKGFSLDPQGGSPLRYDASQTDYGYLIMATEDWDIISTEDGYPIRFGS